MSARRKHTKRSSNASPEARRLRGEQAVAGRSAWSRVDATTDDEIARQIAGDPVTVPAFTNEMLERARWVAAPKKEPISFRVDPDVLEYFRSFGPGYQTRMNQVLRAYMEHGATPPAKRRVSESSAAPSGRRKR